MEKFVITIGASNFHTTPSVTPASNVIEVLAKGSILQLLDGPVGTFNRAINGDEKIGYISLKPEYTKEYVPDWLAKAEATAAYADQYLSKMVNGVLVVTHQYEWGSNRNTDTTFDCSDFMKWIVKPEGIVLHDIANTQITLDGVEVVSKVPRSGDLIGFSHTGVAPFYHIAMYFEPNTILHTYQIGIGPIYSDFSPGSYWRNPIRFARVERIFK